MHHLPGVRGGVPGRHRARTHHRRDAPGAGRRGRHGTHAPDGPHQSRETGKLLRQVRQAASQVGQGPAIHDQGRPEGTGRVPVVRRGLRLV